MAVIAISKFRPYAGKANLVLQNMKDVARRLIKWVLLQKYYEICLDQMQDAPPFIHFMKPLPTQWITLKKFSRVTGRLKYK